MTWLLVICVSIVASYTWLFIGRVMQAKRQLEIARARANLAWAIAELNENSFLSGKINNHSVLHNSYYQYFLSVLCGDFRLNYAHIKNDMSWDDKTDRETKALEDEIESLGPKSKAAVRCAMYSSAKILMLTKPVYGLILFLKYSDLKLNYRKSVEKTSERIGANSPLVKPGDPDYCAA